MKKIYFIFFLIISISNLNAQTNPSPQTIPYSQNFGTVGFSTPNTGMASWTGSGTRPYTTQAAAEVSLAGADIAITNATPANGGGAGQYGHAPSGNGRQTILQSGNATNGTSQIALAINTNGFTSVTISYDLVLTISNARTIGLALQYRNGNSGSFTTITGSAVTYNSGTSNGGDADGTSDFDSYSLSLPAAALNQSEVQLRWITWRGSEAGNSSGIGLDNVSITGVGSPTISITPGTNATEGGAAGTFTINFSPATTGAETVNYDLPVSGNATFTTDYGATLVSAPTTGVTPATLVAINGLLNVPAGVSSITVTITTVDDVISEGPETVTMTLSSPSGLFTLGNASSNITIIDNEPVGISNIQGSGTTATAGSFTVSAIVTGIYPTLSPAGFYIQEEDADADADPNTSEGIFVVSATPVAVGDLVRVTGTVQENGVTPSFNQAVFATATVTVLSSGNPFPATVDITLPVTATADYEKYEGMRVRFPGTLTVTDNDNLGGFGELKLSSGGLVYQPTQIVDPNDNPASGTNSSGASNVAAVNALIASNNLRTILLDDGRGTIPTLPYVNVDNTVRVGSTIDNITGILGYAFSQYRIQPIAAAVPSFTHAARPTVPGYGAGANLKVASFNVLNYFDGTPNASLPNPIVAGFPTPRGAHSGAEFTRQRDKIIKALSGPGPDNINADVVGLIEIANNGTSNPSAIQNLVDGLNSVMGPGTYAFINDGATTQTNNTDQIRCAIIYKPSVVTPVGAAMLGNNAIFDRPPLAQTFNLIATNKTFNFVVNHFKSKGGTGTGADADQGDGQAAFNDRRKQQATALLTFINGTVIPTSGTNRVISVGDYNAYYEEDPMDILRAGGYTVASSATSYSYLFGGQLGSLDHAVVSPSLAGTITGIAKWNTNSVEPTYLDYNDAISTNGSDPVNPWASTYTPSEWRASDHDAILMGLLLDATLPVTLVNFSATKENTSSKISWTTSQEINSRHFIVERSANGSVWQTVAIVPAAGNSNSPIDYSIIDATPAKGINLYRLKSIDLDAKFEYSAIRRINFENKYTFSIYPNPASDVIQVIVDNASVLNANLQILNTQSQVLISKQLNATNQPIQVNVSSLASGLYFIRIITPDGTVNVQKFTKH
jgi:predicted extracellular nuclease